MNSILYRLCRYIYCQTKFR